MYGEQVGQEEISRAGAARQQPGEVEAPPSEPPSTRHHATFHLEAQTAIRATELQSCDNYCFISIFTRHSGFKK